MATICQSHPVHKKAVFDSTVRKKWILGANTTKKHQTITWQQSFAEMSNGH